MEEWLRLLEKKLLEITGERELAVKVRVGLLKTIKFVCFLERDYILSKTEYKITVWNNENFHTFNQISSDNKKVICKNSGKIFDKFKEEIKKHDVKKVEEKIKRDIEKERKRRINEKCLEQIKKY